MTREEQLKKAREVLQKKGLTPIQSSVPLSSTSSGSSANGSNTKQDQKSKPGIATRVFDIYKKRISNIKDSAVQTFSGKQTLSEGVFQTAGQVAGAANDIIGEGFSTAYHALPDSVENKISERNQQLMQTPAGQTIIKGVQKGSEMYGGFKQAHPRAARNVEAAGNIASLIPIGKGGKVATEVAGDIAGAGARQLEKNIVKQSANEALDIVRPVLNKTEKTAALAAGRGEKQGFSIFNKTVIKPSARELEIAESVKDVVSKSAPATKNIENIKAKIGTVGQQVEEGLKSRPAIYNNNQVRATLSKAKQDSRVVFGSDKQLESAYDAVVDEFMKQLDSETKDLYGMWKARQKFDDVIEQRFPGLLSGEAGDNVRKNAVFDVRRAANDYIESRLAEGDPFKKQLRDMSNMYTAVENISERAAVEVDKNLIQRVSQVIRQHPVLSGVSAFGLGAATVTGILANPVAISAALLYGGYKVGKKVYTSKAIKQELLKFLKGAERVLNPEEKAALQELASKLDSASKKTNIGLSIEDAQKRPGQTARPSDLQYVGKKANQKPIKINDYSKPGTDSTAYPGKGKFLRVNRYR